MDMTMTQAPVVNGQSGLVQLNFEGLFYDSPERTTHTGRNTVYPTRVSGLNSNQFFLHETTLNSLFYALDQKYLPLHINSTNETSQLLTLFPEIRAYYGEQVFLDLDIFLKSDAPDLITLRKDTGIEIGKKGQGVVQLAVYCSNETVTKDLAVQFEMGIDAVVNASLYNLFVSLNVPELKIKGVHITHD